jgi:hypothetical protein
VIKIDPNKIVNAVIMMVVILAVAGALYPTLMTYINNITGTFSNTGILVVVGVLYWILIAAGLVLYMLKSFGIKVGKGY